MIPMSSCNEAATYLIQALGGEEQAAKVTGGTRWWQVRGLKGIDANWIVVKKDWVQAKKNQKERERQRQASSGSQQGHGQEDAPEEENATYSSDMDSMRCMLYIHGGMATVTAEFCPDLSIRVCLQVVISLVRLTRKDSASKDTLGSPILKNDRVAY